MATLAQTTSGADGTGGAIDTPLAFATTPTDGNVLVAIAVARADRATTAVPTGFTDRSAGGYMPTTGTNSVRTQIYTKTASSETNSYTWTFDFYPAIVYMFEFAEATESDFIFKADGVTTTANPQSSGVSAAMTAASVGVCVTAWRDGDGGVTPVTFDQSFTKVLEDDVIGASIGAAVGYRLTPLAASSTIEVTGTMTGTPGSDVLTAVLMFADAADSTPPTITITAPTDLATVSGTINVDATFSDDVTAAADAANMAVSIDGGAGAAMSYVSGSTWRYSWDTTGVSNASHTIDVSGDDEAANTGNATQISVTVNNGGGSGRGGEGLLLGVGFFSGTPPQVIADPSPLGVYTDLYHDTY